MEEKITKPATTTKIRIRQKEKDSRKLENEYKSIFLNILSEKDTKLKPYTHGRTSELSISDELARRESIKNTAMEQDIALKAQTLTLLFRFLGAETVVIFIFAFLQATHWLNFNLEVWSFRLLIASTIAQITFMLQVAVKHLFPTKER